MDCRFKDIFGKPREGVHALRIPVLDIALVDTLLTLAAALLISKLFQSSFLWTFLILLVVGVIVHRMLCVDTRLNKLILKKQ